MRAILEIFSETLLLGVSVMIWAVSPCDDLNHDRAYGSDCTYLQSKMRRWTKNIVTIGNRNEVMLP